MPIRLPQRLLGHALWLGTTSLSFSATLHPLHFKTTISSIREAQAHQLNTLRHRRLPIFARSAPTPPPALPPPAAFLARAAARSAVHRSHLHTKP